jgi:hypothetical protein
MAMFSTLHRANRAAPPRINRGARERGLKIFRLLTRAALILARTAPIFLTWNTYAKTNTPFLPPYVETIVQKSHGLPLSKRIHGISNAFLSKPYILYALGEGATGYFDQFPLSRLDGFDCETFVDTVVALALSDGIHYQKCIQRIRYKEGKVGFITRNHFTDIDWNTNNRNMLVDITPSFPHKIATAVIDKGAWIEHLPIDRIHLNPPLNTEAVRMQRLEKLHQKHSLFGPKTVSTPYIPFDILFNTKMQPNMALFKRIPDGAIIEIVRPNWDLTKIIGTHLNISHLGFAIWKDGTLYFRQASSEKHKVCDIPLIDYLKNAANSPTIRGIHIEVVQDVQCK